MKILYFITLNRYARGSEYVNGDTHINMRRLEHGEYVHVDDGDS